MVFPLPLSAYPDAASAPLILILAQRIAQEPLNLVLSLVFLLAIIHTFLAPTLEQKAVTFQGWRRQLLHLGGEVELVFGLWVIPLLLILLWQKGPELTAGYLGTQLDFTEPLFVVVMMTIAGSRPVLQTVERFLGLVAGKSPIRWWWVLLTLGPLLGSLITEPAAMTLCALLLAREFYRLGPSLSFRYATLGLLFVNISVGGTLTHFAAPPVLMVVSAWDWETPYLFWHFGLRAVIGIFLSNTLYYFWFRQEFVRLALQSGEEKEKRVPAWVSLISFLFLGATVYTNHTPVLFLVGFFLFILFMRSQTERLSFRSPLLVGFFLAALVVHGGFQGWWIEPILRRLGSGTLLLGATLLTAFNDNAAITYLATLVPNWSETLKIAVVSGAVCGGGLTVMANAPNPAGQSLLSEFFPKGIHPWPLFLAALLPTLVMLLCFGWGLVDW